MVFFQIHTSWNTEVMAVFLKTCKNKVNRWNGMHATTVGLIKMSMLRLRNKHSLKDSLSLSKSIYVHFKLNKPPPLELWPPQDGIHERDRVNDKNKPKDCVRLVHEMSGSVNYMTLDKAYDIVDKLIKEGVDEWKRRKLTADNVSAVICFFNTEMSITKYSEDYKKIGRDVVRKDT